MAAAFCRSGQISPTNFTRPLEKVFDDAQHTGQIILVGRKLKEYPKLAEKYDLLDTSVADLSRNRLHEIPPAVCDYRSIERLVCYHNVIRCLPDSILQLQCLSYLNLSCNQLSHIPPFICRIQQLEVLVVSNNRLVSIPEELGRLDKLTELDVSCNEISVLPVQLGDLELLRVLNVRKNLLVELPTELSQLKLRKLDFSCNKIGVIPPEYRLIETLDTLLVDHNPLTSPPAHICTKGRVHIMKYLQIEAIKEDKKRGLINDSDLRRYFRKSASQQKTSIDDFTAVNSHLLDPGGEPSSQRDSGYITTEEKPHWSTNGVSKPPDDLPPPYPGRPADLPQQNGSPSPRQTYKPKFTPPSPQLNHSPGTQKPVTVPTANQNGGSRPAANQIGGSRSSANQNGGRGSLTPGVAIDEELPPPPPEAEVDEFTRELQRQKHEYEARKKKAEMLRKQREGEQKAQSEEIVNKVLEERVVDGRPPRREEERLKEGRDAAVDEVKVEENNFLEQQREEARKRLEEKTRSGKMASTSADTVDSDPSRLPPPPAELLQPTMSPPQSLLLSSVHVKTYPNPKTQNKTPSKSRTPSNPDKLVSSHTKKSHPNQPPPGGNPPLHSSSGSETVLSGHSRSGSDVSNSSVKSVPMYSSPRPKNRHDHHNQYQTQSLPRSPPKHARQASLPQNMGVAKSGARSVAPPQMTRRYSEQNQPREEALHTSVSRSQSQQPVPSHGPMTSMPLTGPSHSAQPLSPHEGLVSPPPYVPLNQADPTVQSRDLQAPPHPIHAGQSRVERSDSVPEALVSPTGGHYRQMSEPDPHWMADHSSQPSRTNHPKQEPEFLNRHEAMTRQTHQEASTIRRKIEDEKDRLLKMKKEPLYNYLSQKSSVSEDEATDVHNTSQSSTHSNNSNSSLPANGKDGFNVRLPEELRYINPNFTVRRQFEQAREEMEQIDRLRRDIESRLKVQLPPDVPCALKDGIVLCHLANYVRPRSVSSIHVPPPSATSLTIGKCRRNVENFLEACRKIGVDEAFICACDDITEELRPRRLALTVHHLLSHARVTLRDRVLSAVLVTAFLLTLVALYVVAQLNEAAHCAFNQ